MNIEKFIGIPFVNSARTLNGCDCWGLAILIFKDFGIEIPDYKISCFNTAQIGRTVKTETKKTWHRIKKPIIPSIAVMAIDSKMPGVCNHLGVYIGNKQIIHTMEKTGSHIVKLDHPFYKSCIKGFYELRTEKK